MIHLVFMFLLAAFSIFLSLLIFRARPGNFLNRAMAAALLFYGLWMANAYSNQLFADVGSGYVTWMYRVCYFLIVLSTGSFFLFALAYLRGGRPGKAVTRILAAAILLLALINLTGLTLRQATYQGGVYSQENGPLYAVFVLTEAFLGGGSLLCLELMRRRSRGTDRARVTYILAGFGIYIPLALLLAAVLPGLMKKDVATDIAFYLTAVPLVAIAYAILRHRLLDVRLAVRYAFTYLVTLLIFGLPLLSAYLLISHLWRYDYRVYAAFSACILALAVALTPVAMRRSGRLANRLFFSGLYDEVELLHLASSVIMREGDFRRGVAVAAALVCERLGLRELWAVVPAEMTEGRGTWLLGARREGRGVRSLVETAGEDSPLHRIREATLLLEDRGEVLEDEGERVAREEMEARGLVAAIPLQGPGGPQGVLLVGEKPNRLALDPADLVFLEEFSRRMGLFVEHYLLSFRLMARVEELTRTRDLLEASDRFKTDIINITSHEFRTPLTVLYGFVDLLSRRFGELEEEVMREALRHMEQACARLRRLVDEFHAVSLLRGGKMRCSPRECALARVFREAVEGLEDGEGKRVEVELPDGDPVVFTDPRLLNLVLVHLLENALRYSPPDSPVILRASMGKEGCVEVTVRDFGEGIPREVVDVIFEPFARLEETDKHGKGAGLGLYVVNLAAEVLGIEVRVESEPGRGSAFHLLFPAEAVLGREKASPESVAQV